jgi:hypothetical protein
VRSTRTPASKNEREPREIPDMGSQKTFASEKKEPGTASTVPGNPLTQENGDRSDQGLVTVTCRKPLPVVPFDPPRLKERYS